MHSLFYQILVLATVCFLQRVFIGNDGLAESANSLKKLAQINEDIAVFFIYLYARIKDVIVKKVHSQVKPTAASTRL